VFTDGGFVDGDDGQGIYSYSPVQAIPNGVPCPPYPCGAVDTEGSDLVSDTPDTNGAMFAGAIPFPGWGPALEGLGAAAERALGALGMLLSLSGVSAVSAYETEFRY